MTTAIRFVDDITALKERKREMDDAWLLALMMVFVSLGMLWFWRILDVDLSGVVWIVVVYAASYVAMSLLAARAPTRTKFLTTIGALQIVGIATLTVLWRLTGGFQNPMFLLVFVLPIMTGSLVLPRWQAYTTAALTVLVVFAVALIDNAPLRWYLWQVGLPIGQVLNWISLSQIQPSTIEPFPAAVQPPQYLAAALFLFGAVMFTAAGVADAISHAVRRIETRSIAVADSRARVESLSAEVMQRTPVPTALIYADTFRIAQASQSFFQQLFVEPEAPAQRHFFELVMFSYPEAIEALVVGRGGEVPLAAVDVRGEKRFMHVRVSPISHFGTRYACVSLQDVTDAHYRTLAADALEHPLIVIGQGRVRSFNAAAEARVPHLVLGGDPSGPLTAANLPFAWWTLGVRSHQRCEVQLAGRTFTAVCRAAGTAGERDPLTVVTLTEEKSTT